jgi:hypothetical protein
MRVVIDAYARTCTPPCPPTSSHFPLHFCRRSKASVTPWSEPLRGGGQPGATRRGRGRHNGGDGDATRATQQRRGRHDEGRHDKGDMTRATRRGRHNGGDTMRATRQGRHNGGNTTRATQQRRCNEGNATGQRGEGDVTKGDTTGATRDKGASRRGSPCTCERRGAVSESRK